MNDEMRKWLNDEMILGNYDRKELIKLTKKANEPSKTNYILDLSFERLLTY